MTQKRYKELFRDPKKGKIAGVCAGLADYLGWEIWLVQVLVISCFLLGSVFFVVVLYVAAWFILEVKPQSEQEPFVSGHHQNNAPSHSDNTSSNHTFNHEPIKVKARVWQSGEPPKQALHDIKTKFTAIETQLRKMERYITSADFTVSREINKL